ncbi:hypothetical protein Droror1_Dr00011560 [Drosera rotundifolia]
MKWLSCAVFPSFLIVSSCSVFAASPASDSLPAEEAKGMKFAMGGHGGSGHAADGHAIGGHGEAGGHGEGSAGTGGDPAHPGVGTQPMGHDAVGGQHSIANGLGGIPLPLMFLAALMGTLSLNIYVAVVLAVATVVVVVVVKDGRSSGWPCLEAEETGRKMSS